MYSLIWNSKSEIAWRQLLKIEKSFFISGVYYMIIRFFCVKLSAKQEEKYIKTCFKFSLQQAYFSSHISVLQKKKDEIKNICKQKLKKIPVYKVAFLRKPY